MFIKCLRDADIVSDKYEIGNLRSRQTWLKVRIHNSAGFLIYGPRTFDTPYKHVQGEACRRELWLRVMVVLIRKFS